MHLPMIEIKRARLEDADFFLESWNNPELMKSVGFIDGLNTNLEKVIKTIKEKNLYVIWFNTTPIGELNHKNAEDGVMEFGIKLLPEYQSQGKGFKILVQYFKYLKSLGGDVLRLDVLSDNLKAINLYNKLGFNVTEERKNGWVDPKGVARDYLIMEKKNGT